MENHNKHLTPVWIVYVDGKRLDTDHEGALKKIVVDDKLNDVGMATLLFDTSYTKVRQTGTFSLESEVSIHLGYKDDCEQVFVGDVTEFIPEFNEYGHEQLKVVCKNCLYKLQNAHRALSFESKLLSDVLMEPVTRQWQLENGKLKQPKNIAYYFSKLLPKATVIANTTNVNSGVGLDRPVMYKNGVYIKL